MKRYIRADITDMDDEDYETQAELATQPRERTLTTLSKSKYAGIRNKVASNPATPADILEKLSRDPLRFVRYGILSNPNASEKLKSEVSNSSNDYSGIAQFTFYISTFEDGDDPAVADIPKLIYEFAAENGYNCTYADYVADEGAYEGERRFDVECHDMFSEDQIKDFESGVSDYLDSAGWYVENSGFDRLLRE